MNTKIFIRELFLLMVIQQPLVAMANYYITTPKVFDQPRNLDGNFLKINFSQPPEILTNPDKSQNATRSRRSLVNDDDPFAPPSDICNLPRTELLGLTNVLQEASNELSQSSSGNQTSSSSCSSMITFVKNQGHYITTQIKLLKRHTANNTKMYDEAKMQLSAQLERFNKFVTNLKESHHNLQPNLTGNFNTTLSAYQKQVNDLFAEIEDLNAQGRENTIRLCVARIKSGEPLIAFQHWNNINDTDRNTTTLTRISKEAYNNDPDNVAKIVDFVRLLDNCSQSGVAYQAVFDEMKRNGHLDSPELLTILDATKSCSDILEPFKEQLYPYGKAVMEDWATRISRGGNTEQINEYAKRNFREYRFYNLIPLLIKASYSGDIDEFPAIIHFINKLPGYVESVLSYTALLNEMKKSGHLYTYETVQLADRVKRVMNQGNYALLNQEIKDLFANLKNSFPPNVMGMIWNGNSCRIKNEYHSEYLYAENSNYLLDSHDRKVFTWVPGGHVSNSYWKIESLDEAVSFTIKNAGWNEHLYASSENFRDSGRRWVLTYRNGRPVWEGFWKLKPVDDHTFTIINKETGEHLYADADLSRGDGRNRRAVFTMRIGIPNENKWKIHC